MSPDWNIEWGTWQGPSRTTVGNLKILLSYMVYIFKVNMVRRDNHNTSENESE